MAKSLSLLSRIKTLVLTKWGMIAVGAVVVLGSGYLLFGHKAQTYQLVTVTRGSVTETVTQTGNTTPTKSVTLAFGNGGTVAHTYAALGDHVAAGQTLAELDSGDLFAQLRQAQANVDSAQAKLDSLRTGAQPADIAASQAALNKAQQDLANLYQTIIDTSNDAFTKAGDAVRTQLGGFFSNPETNSPQLNFISSNSQSVTNAQNERVAATTALNAWQTELGGVSSASSAAMLETLLTDDLAYLASISALLGDTSRALDGASNLSATTQATYKTSVGVGQAEVNTATKNLNTISQQVASQKLTISQAQAQLDLKRAGATQSDINAQVAAVEAAQASADSVAAKLKNSRLVAPFAGTVTQFDAKVGQYAPPSTPLVSLISSGGYEVDAGVSETDIGKLAVGDKVSMTLDAFANESFTGSVFYIAPAETNQNGVINYQIKISFDTPDPRLKSGLTANLTIQTKQKSGVLVLPQYAILQNDSGTFVETLQGSTPTTTPVTLGIQDEKGNVEILSGVYEGQQVLNIGLKK